MKSLHIEIHCVIVTERYGRKLFVVVVLDFPITLWICKQDRFIEKHRLAVKVCEEMQSTSI